MLYMELIKSEAQGLFLYSGGTIVGFGRAMRFCVTRTNTKRGAAFIQPQADGSFTLRYRENPRKTQVWGKNPRKSYSFSLFNKCNNATADGPVNLNVS
jgi:hypothetical protein